MTYLWHVTLNTGDAGRFERPVDIADAQQDLAAALADPDGMARASAARGYMIKVTVAGMALAVSIIGAVSPLVTMGVARRSRGAQTLWRIMHDAPYDLATDPDNPPKAPWLAVRVEPSLIDDPGASVWLADYERALAWAWIKRPS